MSLEKVDIRGKLDPDIHKVLLAICEHRGITISEFIESLVVPEIRRIVEQSLSVVAALPGKGTSGNEVGDSLQTPPSENTGAFRVTFRQERERLASQIAEGREFLKAFKK